jgi:hypothetical protein
MTPRNRNILIGLGALVGTILIARYLYRKNNTPDKLSLDVTNIDDDNKSFDYVVKNEDGSVLTSGSFNVRDLDKVEVLGKNRITISTDYTKSFANITGYSVNKKQFNKKVKFKEQDGVQQLGATLEAVTQGGGNV